jgi:predicted aldo/keto reductase-like oxidoreductase
LDGKGAGRFFLGCKTLERTRAGAAAELRSSLERLRVDSFDLYQIHAITTLEELDSATAKGAALDAIRDAREAGVVRHIGITGHGVHGPQLFLEALRRFDFDSVLFPINPRLYADPDYRRDSEELVRECRARDVGTMIIKAVSKEAWGERIKTFTTWYEPFADAGQIQEAVNFALSQDVTGLCSAGDTTILPMFLDACEHFAPLSATRQEAFIAAEAETQPLWV